MRRDIKDVGPSFREMAHGNGIAVAATCDAAGHPHTRHMQQVWVWDGSTLTGWASTDTDAPKAGDPEGNPRIRFTHWNATHRMEENTRGSRTHRRIPAADVCWKE